MASHAPFLLKKRKAQPPRLIAANQEDGAGASAAAVTEREFRRYFDCGILAHGFARARFAAFSGRIGTA